jgi:DNA polymerase-1
MVAKKIDSQVKEGKLPASARTERVAIALEKRNHIKSVGFGLNYGMKENKLARQLGISKEEAKAIIEAYLGTYPAVSAFYESAITETQQTGYSFTLLGRRRFHPGIASPNPLDRWGEERKAVNNQIQGTAADAVRLAMINCDKANLEAKYGCKMLLQIHDELMFECPAETAEAAKAEIEQIMRHPFPTDLIVPLDVSIGIGSAWNTAK